MKVQVKFIKEHPAGIPEGAVHTVHQEDAERWQEQGYVEIVGEAATETPSEVTVEEPAEEPVEETTEPTEVTVEEPAATQEPVKEEKTSKKGKK